ncbi:HEAT repeat domain-containing protein [Microcoleus sp. PH2017_30_WIL_O_A]|uniref:HEAT repeat domain-containing protein n=1 Tax=Microcoleus sp. PH2017_30_WIL_O_A TaxID=2798840 RepID=UPI001DC5D39A|nr:HEAT repeat domain-containing protein [Microcoleus sp. PH2017_30_WIL_O_A]MCC3582656.1 HEAT repeat domain-containing protein [Microcoleus sp. PH2017_30_WIL_O_A]
MDKLVVFNLGEGDFKQGFPVTLQVWEEGSFLTSFVGKLPASAIDSLYDKWQSDYRQKISGRMIPTPGRVSNYSDTDLTGNSHILKAELNNWLNSETFRPVRDKFLTTVKSKHTVRVIIQTENPRLRRLPWYLWDLFVKNYPLAEMALSSPTFERVEKSVQPKPKVRILAILGDSSPPDPKTGIRLDINADKQFLENLPDAETVFLVEPKRHEFNEQLWDERGWDILFFAGHSTSESDGTTGKIYINSKEYLTIDDLKPALHKAIQRGLQLAIFNSCDGLGIARDLAELQIPQIIAMREPVADLVAKEFLKYFLDSFSKGQHLYLAVREARERLHGLEKDFPCASWLPVICQNPAENPVTWQGLRGVKAGINWRDACLRTIPERGKLTSNSLVVNDGLNLNVDDVYVPLGLVERKQKPKPDKQTTPDKGSQLYDAKTPSKSQEAGENYVAETQYEVTKTFKNDEFFGEVLKQGKTDKSKGKRIAIIGEPGAGKTTLLQKIADWVLAETEVVPIWVSLADLGKFSLEDYLLQKWLKVALNVADVTAQMRQDLVMLFNNHQVWLLLDAADEMSAGNPLDEIKSQLRGWMAEARVVLTCRYNVWDAGKNALAEFDVYRNLDFDEEEQIPQFIRSVFQHSDLGEKLCEKLAESENARLRDTVKNPLRLTLLCLAWHIRQGDFTTKTQADLYAQFTEAVYEWKCEKFPTTSQQRRELNKALATLALRGMEEKESRFRLRQGWVREVLGETDEPLCELALQLGWINRVGVAAERPEEQVYAFYHPTFQEYFAALGVDDWDFFLPRNHVDRPVKDETGKYKHYIIFDKHWKEVILLWIGRDDVPKESKETLIGGLTKFQDNCGSFYVYRSYFLAAMCVVEFRNCSLDDKIVAQLVKWRCGYFEPDKQKWLTFPETIKKTTLAALRQMNREKVNTALIKAMQTCPDFQTRHKVFYILWRIDIEKANSYYAIISDELIKYVDSPDFDSGEITQYFLSYNFYDVKTIFKSILYDKLIFNLLMASLLYISSNGNEEEVIDAKNNLIYSFIQICIDTPDSLILLADIMRLERKNIDSQAVCERIINIAMLLNTQAGTLLRSNVLAQLAKFNPNGLTDTRAFLISQIKNDSLYKEAFKEALIEGMVRTFISNPNEIIRLVFTVWNWILTYRDNSCEDYNDCAMDTRRFQFAQARADTIAEWLHTCETDSIRWFVASIGGRINSDNPDASAIVTKLLHTTEDEFIRWLLADSLREINRLNFHNDRKIDNGNLDAIETLAELLNISQNEEIVLFAAESMYKIDSNNLDAIAALRNLLYNCQDNSILWQVCFLLLPVKNFHLDDSVYIINLLTDCLRTCTNKYILKQCVTSLKKIGTDNPDTIAALTQLLHSCEDEKIRRLVISSLGEINSGNSDAITALTQLLRINDDNKTRKLAAYNLVQICKSNPDEIAALNQLLHTCEDEETRRLAAYNLGQIDPGNSDAIALLTQLLRTCEDEETRSRAAYNLGEIGSGNPDAIAALTELLRTSENKNISSSAASALVKICKYNREAITILIQLLHTCNNEVTCEEIADGLVVIGESNPDAIVELTQMLRTSQNEKTRRLAAHILRRINPDNAEAIDALTQLLSTCEDKHTRWKAAKSLRQINNRTLLEDFVSGLRYCLSDNVNESDYNGYHDCYQLLWDCSQNLTYPQFYTAWHHQLTSTNPQTPNNSPVGETLLTKFIENQITPNFSQLQPTPQTYPLPINIQSLTDETDTSAICQEICTQIYYLALPDTDIPTANNFAQLKRHILTAKRQLQKRHLALILHECTPHPTLITCCRKIADANLGLHIAWITNTPLDAPLRGFPPQQPNLLGALQTWINELS